MTTLVNNGNGGTLGGDVTTLNSGASGDNAFNGVVWNSNTHVYYGSNVGPSAVKSIRVTSAASAAQPAYVQWTTSLIASGGTSAQVNSGAWYYFPSIPGQETPLQRGLQSGTQRWRVTLGSDMVVRGRGAGNISGTVSGISLSTNTFYWIEVESSTSSSGTLRVYIYNVSGTQLDVKTATGLNLGGAQNDVRYGYGAADFGPSASLEYEMSALRASTDGFLGPPVTATPSVAYGPRSGGITSATATAAWTLADAGGLNCRVVASTASNLLTSPIYSSAAAPDSDGIFMGSVSGLAADTQYYYGVEVDGTLLADGRGEFRTLPPEGQPSNGCYIFGSCNISPPWDTDTFALAAAYSGPQGPARMFVHLGDDGYPDWGSGTTQAQVRAHYQALNAMPKRKALEAKMPISYTPNNHDWAAEPCDKNSPAGPAVAAAVRQCIPGYNLPAADGRGFFHAWTDGRIRHISLDMRSQRDPSSNPNNSSKTMLGADQKAWLESELQRSEPVKIIYSDVWRAALGDSSRWGAYTYEFGVINDMIDAYCPGRVFVASGDRHALGADDGSALYTRGRPNVIGAPFNTGSVQAYELWSHGYWYSYQTPPVEEAVDALGVLEWTDDGSTIEIVYRGITSDGIQRLTMTTVFETSVSTAIDLRYDTKAIVQDTNALRWNSFATVSDTNALRWDAWATVADSLGLSWDTKAIVSGSNELRYDTRAIVEAANELRYDAYARALASNAIRFHTRSIAVGETNLRWNARAVTSRSNVVRFNVYQLTNEAEADLRWDTPAIVSIPNDLRWGLYATVGAESSLRWNAFATVEATAEILYEIQGESSVSRTLSIRYHTFARTSDAAGLSWHTMAQVSDSVDARWDALALAESGAQLRWDTYRRVPDSVDLLWQVNGTERTKLYIPIDRGPVAGSVGSDGPVTASAPKTRAV